MNRTLMAVSRMTRKSLDTATLLLNIECQVTVHRNNSYNKTN